MAPLAIFHVRTHGVSTADVPKSPSPCSLKPPRNSHPSNSLSLAARTKFACATSPSPDDSWPNSRLHLSAARADSAASAPPAAEEREAATCGFNSGYRHLECPLIRCLAAAEAARKTSLLQRLPGTTGGPYECSAASSGGRPPFSPPVAEISIFPATPCVRLEFYRCTEANLVSNAALESLRRYSCC